MTAPTGTARDLPGRLEKSLAPETDTPNTPTINNFPFAWPTGDDDERITITLNLSFAEYQALSSVVDVGSDIAYGENAIYLWWLWVRSTNSMEFCDQLIDCLTTDPNTQTALDNFVQAYLENNGYGSGDGGNPDSPTNYVDDVPLLDGAQVPGCNNNNLFGGITQLVDFMNGAITDAFEGFEAGSAVWERRARALAAFPITDVLAIDDLVLFSQQMYENLAQNYAGAYTQALRDEYRCDLFCLVKDTCQLNFQDWADYFYGRAGATQILASFPEGIEWFLNGVFSGENYVHAAHAVFAQILAFGSRWLDIDMAWFSRVLTSFLNDPDSDWITLCADCPDFANFCYEIDFSSGLGQWVIADNNGQLIASGVQATFNLNNRKSLIISIDAGESFVWGGFEIEYDWDGTASVADLIDVRGYATLNQQTLVGTSEIQLFSATFVPTGTNVIRCEPDSAVNDSSRRYLYFNMRNTNSGSTDTILLRRIRLFKQSAAPAGIASNCGLDTC